VSAGKRTGVRSAAQNAVQVQNIEKNLSVIIQQFEEMRKDLVFLLSENADPQN